MRTARGQRCDSGIEFKAHFWLQCAANILISERPLLERLITNVVRCDVVMCAIIYDNIAHEHKTESGGAMEAKYDAGGIACLR